MLRVDVVPGQAAPALAATIGGAAGAPHGRPDAALMSLEVAV